MQETDGILLKSPNTALTSKLNFSVKQYISVSMQKECECCIRRNHGLVSITQRPKTNAVSTTHYS